jgi:hypothetical protein
LWSWPDRADKLYRISLARTQSDKGPREKYAMTKPGLHIAGMHGLGDCIHQRAIVRQLMRTHSVTLETSWASLYHDLVGPDLKLARRAVGLRTQAKNAQRESEKFSSLRFAYGMRHLRVAYSGSQVLASPSKTILEVMCNVTGTDYATADYRLPIPDAWSAGLFKKLGPLPAKASHRPWLVYRPLVARHEWRGSIQRNASPSAYAAIFDEIQIAGDFFVVSVADLEPGKEWLVGSSKADLTLHGGELVFEDMAALFSYSDLALTSSGFAAILAPAVSTPCISVIGGYEDPRCHDSGARFAPYLSIGPRAPCTCWTSRCARVCDKTTDLETARPRVREFVAQLEVEYPDARQDHATPVAP